MSTAQKPWLPTPKPGAVIAPGPVPIKPAKPVPTEQDVRDKLTDLVATLEAYRDAHLGTDKERKLTASLFKWLKTKVTLIGQEATFVEPTEVTIERGTVCWMDLGVNIGHEFGGIHPILVLKRTPGMVFILPLSTQEPTPEQQEEGIYVEVPVVYGRFPNKRRWVNILDLRTMSIQRIDFTSKFGFVKGPVLDNINVAFAARGAGTWQK